ncbi:MAG: hypothetical protein AAGC77_10590 [Pseudomonadota bacterium]
MFTRLIANTKDGLQMVWVSWKLAWREAVQEGETPDLRCEIVEGDRVLLKLSSLNVLRRFHAVCADYLEQDKNHPSSAFVAASLVNWAIARSERHFYMSHSDFKCLLWLFEVYPEYGYGLKRTSSEPAPVDKHQYDKFAAALAQTGSVMGSSD